MAGSRPGDASFVATEHFGQSDAFNPLILEVASRGLASPFTPKEAGPLGEPVAPLSVLDATRTAFAQRHHLSVQDNNGEYVFTLHANGVDEPLFRTEASEKGISVAEQKLAAMVAEEEGKIARDFHVSIAASGEEVEVQRKSADSNPLQSFAHARDPELFELAGLRAGLAKSIPSNLDSDGRGVKIDFLQEPTVLEDGSSLVASMQNDREGRAAIYLWPDASKISAATEKDLPLEERQKSYFDPTRMQSIEGCVIHELGHHQFAKLGFSAGIGEHNVPAPLTARGEKLLNDMGWLKPTKDLDGDWSWLLEGKRVNADGSQASYIPEYGAISYKYARRDQTGRFMDADGKHSLPNVSEYLNDKEMREQALVAPPSWYYQNPREEYAEAVRLFRSGEESRNTLKDTSPVLYRLIEKNDQTEIDNSFGTKGAGAPKFVRALSGQLIEK